MKTWKKWMAGMLCATSAVWIGITAHTMAASAECSDPDVCAVYDDAVVLTAEEEQELDDRIRETAEKIDMNVAVFLSGTRVDRADTRDTAADYYIELFGEKVTACSIIWICRGMGTPRMPHMTTSIQEAGRSSIIPTAKATIG